MRRRKIAPDVDGGSLQAHLTDRDGRTGLDLMDAMRLVIEYDLTFGVQAPTTQGVQEGQELQLVPSDPFRDEVVRCIGSEIVCEDWLEPKSWAASKPHLEIVTTIGRDRMLRVSVRPWREFTDTRSGQKLDGHTDFGRLNEGSRPLAIEAMQFDLGVLGHPTASDDESEAAQTAVTLQRMVVSKLYEYTVSNLSRRFTCRVQSGLVCFGPAKELTVRERKAANEVEVANLLPDKSTHWHPTLPKLCASLGVRVDEVMSLFRERLADLPIEQQAQTLLEFSGRKAQYGARFELPTQLARALGAVCSTEGRVSLSPGNEKDAQAELDRLHENPRAICSQLYDVYGLAEADAWAVIRLVHPELHRQLSRSARRWREEIEAVERGDHPAWETPAEMARRMVEQLKIEAAALAKRWDVQLRRVTETMGLDRDGLERWGNERAPAVAQWVRDMVATKGGTLKRGRVSGTQD